MNAALDDQAASHRLLQQQIENQLARLSTQEDNLIEPAADGSLDSGRFGLSGVRLCVNRHISQTSYRLSTEI